MQALRRVATRGLVAAPRTARSFSALSAFDFATPDGDVAEFPRRARGLDMDLNWSLASDKVTTRGEAYRNAGVRDLIEFLPRAGTKVTKAKAVAVADGVLGKPAKMMATDVVPGAEVMDVEAYEALLEDVLNNSMSFAPRLFVEDGAVAAASRTSELRVRVVSDSPAIALAFRSLLHRIPLYAPEVFPRTLTVYVSSLYEGCPPTVVVDVDPTTAKATVLAAGGAALGDIQAAVASAAGRLMAQGGYRHVPGGDQNANLREARADGVLSWYAHDGHWYASAAEAHPDLLLVPGATVVVGGAGATMVVGASSAFAGKALAAGQLYAAGGAVVMGDGSVSGVFSGATVPAMPAEAAPRGAVTGAGATTLPLSVPGAVKGLSKVVVVGDAASKLGFNEKQAALWGKLKVETAATEADAAAMLGLA